MYYERIEHLRIDHDYTQEYVARYLKIQREVYRRYEKGTRTIPPDFIVKLAELYDTSTDYILGVTNNPKSRRSKASKSAEAIKAIYSAKQINK